MAEELFDDFGHPAGQDDIARSEGILNTLFIETQTTRDFLDSDPDYLVVYGPKGAGKSLLLFKKALQVRHKSGAMWIPNQPYAYSPGGDYYSDTEKWLPFWPLQNRKGVPQAEDWASLWSWALATCILQRWRDLAKKWVEDEVDEQGSQMFLDAIDPLLQSESEDNPYSLIAAKLYAFAEGGSRLHGRSILPPDLTSVIARHANRFPPSYVFIDNQDDLYESNPEHWTASGAGCYQAIRRIKEKSGHRVKIFMTLRREVIDELRQNQHWPMWVRDLHGIRWSDDDLIRVLTERARSLKPSRLRSAARRAEDPLRAFFGDEFRRDGSPGLWMRVPRAESGRGRVFVPLEDYLLRHTLRRPRDLIVLGNRIIAERAASGIQDDPVEVVRRAVDSAASQDIAGGYLAEIHEEWVWGEKSTKSMKHFISRYVEKNIISQRERVRIERSYARELGLPPDDVTPFLFLARNGLVGWVIADPNKSRAEMQCFVHPGDPNLGDNLPRSDYYLIHPILYGAPFNVKVAPGVVIGPELPFRRPPKRKHRSCFISYGGPDAEIAQRLKDELESQGVECWCRIADAEPCEKAWDEAHHSMAVADWMLCICSRNSVKREGFASEVIRQHDIDPRKLIVVSIDEGWDSEECQKHSIFERAQQILRSHNPIVFPVNDFGSGVARVLDVLRKATSKGTAKEPQGAAKRASRSPRAHHSDHRGQAPM